MRSPVNRLVGHGCAIARVALMAAVLVAPSAWAGPEDDAREREKDRFAVGMAITSGVLIGQQNGRVETSADVTVPPPLFLTGEASPRFVPVETPAPFARPAVDALNAVSPFVGVNLELMTPALDIVPGAPRVFGAVEFLPTFASKSTVALQGVATEFKIPDFEPRFFPANAISGTGSRVDAEVMTSIFAANLGVAFAFEVRERLLRVKPAVGWIRWGVIAEGKALDAYKDDPDVFPPVFAPPFYGSNIRLVEISGRGSGFFNAVGPGLEIEMELGRRGPFRPVMFLGGFAYRTVGEDSIVFTEQTTVNDPLGEATYGARWTFQVDPWTYRAALGFRLRWVGD